MRSFTQHDQRERVVVRRFMMFFHDLSIRLNFCDSTGSCF